MMSVEFCVDGMMSFKELLKFLSFFNDLIVSEIIVVRDYLLKQVLFNFMEYFKVIVDSNYIYLIQLFLLLKEEVLEYLDNNGVKFE